MQNWRFPAGVLKKGLSTLFEGKHLERHQLASLHPHVFPKPCYLQRHGFANGPKVAPKSSFGHWHVVGSSSGRHYCWRELATLPADFRCTGHRRNVLNLLEKWRPSRETTQSLGRKLEGQSCAHQWGAGWQYNTKQCKSVSLFVKCCWILSAADRKQRIEWIKCQHLWRGAKRSPKEISNLQPNPIHKWKLWNPNSSPGIYIYVQ